MKNRFLILMIFVLAVAFCFGLRHGSAVTPEEPAVLLIMDQSWWTNGVNSNKAADVATDLWFGIGAAHSAADTNYAVGWLRPDDPPSYQDMTDTNIKRRIVCKRRFRLGERPTEAERQTMQTYLDPTTTSVWIVRDVSNIQGTITNMNNEVDPKYNPDM